MVSVTHRESGSTLTTRSAAPSDFDLIAGFIRKLADYEHLLDEVRFDESLLRAHLFGDRPSAEVLIGEIDGSPAGFALFFPTFSTFEGRPGIYLEDLFVEPAARGSGLGRQLLQRLAQLTVERGGARLEWSVLAWNQLARNFYSGLGARPDEGWERWRIEGSALATLALDPM